MHVDPRSRGAQLTAQLQHTGTAHEGLARPARANHAPAPMTQGPLGPLVRRHHWGHRPARAMHAPHAHLQLRT